MLLVRVCKNDCLGTALQGHGPVMANGVRSVASVSSMCYGNGRRYTRAERETPKMWHHEAAGSDKGGRQRV